MNKIITALVVQKNNKNRMNVFLDGQFAFGISSYISRFLHIGQKICQSEVEDLIKQDSRETALQKALQFIGYKTRTQFEVEKKLQSLNYCGEIIQSVIYEMIEKGYINDRDFAEQWIEIRSLSKPRSRRQMEFELKRKGIPQDIIFDVLKEAPDEKKLAFELGKKYITRYQNLGKREFKQKMSGVLARRGFSFDVIRETIEEIEGYVLDQYEKEKEEWK